MDMTTTLQDENFDVRRSNPATHCSYDRYPSGIIVEAFTGGGEDWLLWIGFAKPIRARIYLHAWPSTWGYDPRTESHDIEFICLSMFYQQII
jgi:hypothetical protein